jgi:anaerobic dimethyl sulfoxide reductase subunit A
VGPRGSESFRPITWEKALARVAAALVETRRRHGTKAVLHAVGAGSVGGRGISGGSASRRFFTYWGPVSEASGNESFYCAQMAESWMLGGGVSGSDRATLLDSHLIILWGNNPAETRMGPNTEHFIAEARDRGARVLLIDPRHTDSGVLADEWIPIRPGTDAALVAAIVYRLEQEGAVDTTFLARYTRGYDAYRAYVLGERDGIAKTPDWAAAITGVPVATIHRLARDLATRKPAAILPGWGPQRALYGEQAPRAFITLACVTGNVGLRGGGVAGVGIRSNRIPVQRLPLGPYGIGRHLAPGNWGSEILAGRLDPPVRMAYIVASNVINRSPDAATSARALAQLDFVVVQDPFFTPTARHADIVLPAAADMERPDLTTSWGHDSHLFYNRELLSAPGEARSDYAIFAALAERLGLGEAYTGGRTEAEWIEHLTRASDLPKETLQQEGVHRIDGAPRVALADFRRNPDAHPLQTPSGRIEIRTPAATEHGLPDVPAYIPPDEPKAEAYPLHLLTPHSRLRSNSCAHANPWLQRLEPHAVWINPADAQARGIQADDLVEVCSAQGTIRLPARVTPRIMPGVVCVYQGAWYAPNEDGVDVGGCANTLTAQRQSPSGGYATHTTHVDVRRVAQ